jgi:hypothetical protein
MSDVAVASCGGWVIERGEGAHVVAAAPMAHSHSEL